LSRPVLEPIERPVHWLSTVLFPGVRWPVREADHSLPFRSGVNA
jgi:hypothetical protein